MAPLRLTTPLATRTVGIDRGVPPIERETPDWTAEASRDQ